MASTKDNPTTLWTERVWPEEGDYVRLDIGLRLDDGWHLDELIGQRWIERGWEEAIKKFEDAIANITSGT